MAKPLSLADVLGVLDEKNGETPSSTVDPVEITDPKEFAEAVLQSREFRQYVVRSLTLGELPAAVTTRIMDYGWGKPVDRVEFKDISRDVTGMTKAEILEEIRSLQELAAELPDEDGPTLH